MRTNLRRFACILLSAITLQAFGFQQTDKSLILTKDASAKGKAYSSVHALLIGIDTYPNLPRNLQLAHAVDDARALKAVLSEQYGFADVSVLTDKGASLAAIRTALSTFADNTKIKPDDLVLIYFSGHGQTVKTAAGGEIGFLIPSDAKVDLANPTNSAPYLETCLPMKQVWDYLDLSPAKHAVVIADACFSGLLARTRGIGLSNTTLSVLLARRARQVITAGGSGQSTIERDDLGHGIFTAKLLGELNARAKGKAFTLSDLFASLQEQVSNATDGKQTPQLGNFDSEGEVVFVPTGSVGTANGESKVDPVKTEPPKTEPKKIDPPKSEAPSSSPNTGAGIPAKIPLGLSKRQGQFYLKLRDILTDAPNRFANLPRKGARQVTKPEGSVDVKLFELAKPLPGFDFGGVTDSSGGESFLYFEGTPQDWIQVFEDYKEAVRALTPGGREQHFDDTNWRIADRNFQISLRRDRESSGNRGASVYHTVTLTILKLR